MTSCNWTHLPCAPIGKVNHQSIQIGRYVYVFGGHNPNLNDIEDNALFLDIIKWSIESHTWFTVPLERTLFIHTLSNKLSTRSGDLRQFPFNVYGHTLVKWKEKAWLFGGRCNYGERKNDIFYFTPETKDQNAYWTMLDHTYGSCPDSVDGHSAVVIGNCMLIFGGFCESSQSFNNFLHMFNFESFTWKRISTYSEPSPDLDPIEISVVNTENLNHYFLTTNDGEFTCKTKYPLPREFASLILSEGRVFLFGGRSIIRTSVEIYDSTLWELKQFGGQNLETLWEDSRAYWTPVSTGHGLNTKKMIYKFFHHFKYKPKCFTKKHYFEIKRAYLYLKIDDDNIDYDFGDYPLGRRSHSCWSYGGKLYICFGVISNHSRDQFSVHFNDMWTFDVKTSEWSQLYPLKGQSIDNWPVPRRRACCTLITGPKPFVFFYGGALPRILQLPYPWINDNDITKVDTYVNDISRLVSYPSEGFFQISTHLVDENIDSECHLLLNDRFIYLIIPLGRKEEKAEIPCHVNHLRDFFDKKKPSTTTHEYVRNCLLNVQGLNSSKFLLEYHNCDNSRNNVDISIIFTKRHAHNRRFFTYHFSRYLALSCDEERPRILPLDSDQELDRVLSTEERDSLCTLFFTLLTSIQDETGCAKTENLIIAPNIIDDFRAYNKVYCAFHAHLCEPKSCDPPRKFFQIDFEEKLELLDALNFEGLVPVIDYSETTSNRGEVNTIDGFVQSIDERLLRKRNFDKDTIILFSYGSITFDDVDAILDSNQVFLLNLSINLADLCLKELSKRDKKNKQLEMIPKENLFRWSTLKLDQEMSSALAKNSKRCK